MDTEQRQIGILGAGISGLSVAYMLSKKGYEVSVYEQSDEPGGVIQTKAEDGWTLELGPNSLLINTTQAREFIENLGLESECVEANPLAKKRFIVKDGKPVALPLSGMDFLTSTLLSVKAKFALLKEPFVRVGDSRESIADFFSRRLGREPLDYGVNPFVSGVYAGDPEKLSIKHTFTSLYEMEQEHGSITRGMLAKRDKPKVKRSLLSFKDGMQTLPRKIAGEISSGLHLGTKVLQLRRKDRTWQVKTSTGSYDHDAVISTIPAHALQSVLKTPQTAALANIPYAPMSVLHLGFREEAIEHPLDGFGMLVPKVENHKLLGCLFSSTLFEHRAPEGRVLLTCFLGGARNPDLAHKPKDKLYHIALKELKVLLGIREDPVFTHHTFWKHAIPQYELGYDDYLASIKELENNNSGLFISGNFRNGVSVPDRITEGMELATRIDRNLAG